MRRIQRLTTMVLVSTGLAVALRITPVRADHGIRVEDRSDLAGFGATLSHADVVTDWADIMLRTVVAVGYNPPVMSRVAAIVQASVFDAVNGIERRYEPFHVDADAPHHASSRAAAVQAAYRALVTLAPAQQPMLDAARQQSLDALALEELHTAIERGLEWGDTVANEILAWRSTDGFQPDPPPFLGGPELGQWRPTPPGFLPGLTPQFAVMTPWAIESPSQFRPEGPPALLSAEYAADFNETKMLGALTGSLRTEEESQIAIFWQSIPPTVPWSRIAMQLSAARHFSLVDHARLLAHLTLAMADSVIACWDAKYHYQFWRPVTAIPLADFVGNPDTVSDPDWLPFLVTPPFPEYPSAHSSQSGAAAAVIAAYFGADSPFVAVSDVLPGVTRSFSGVDAAQDEIADARIFGGMHFRTACRDARTMGNAIGEFVLENILQLQGNGHGHRHHDGHGGGHDHGDR
jgi:hypothetical protein